MKKGTEKTGTITINRKELENATKALVGLGISCGELPLIYIRDGFLSIHGETIAARIKVKGLSIPGTAVPLKTFMDFLKGGRMETVNLSLKKELQMICGRVEAGLPISPIPETGIIPFPDTYKKSPEGLLEAIIEASKYCGTDSGPASIACVYISDGQAIGCNNVQAVKIPFSGKVSGSPWCLPTKIAKSLSENLKLIGLVKREDSPIIFFHFDNGLELMTSLSSEKYPIGILKMFDGEKGDKVSFPKKLIDFLPLADSFSDGNSDMEHSIEIESDGSFFHIKTNGPLGWIKNRIKGEAPPFTISVNPLLLSKTIETGTATLGKRMIRMENGNSVYILALFSED